LQPEKAGWYYVETKQTFPFRGCSWYPVATVQLGLEYHLIAYTDIKFQYIPSEVLAPDHFVPYLDRIEQAFEGLVGNFTTSNTKSTKEWNFTSVMKAVKCSLVGAFAQKDRHSEWVRATLSPATAASWTVMDGTDQECFVSQPLLSTDHKFNQIYVGRFTQKRAIESSACFIREEVLEASSRAMFLIEQEIKSIGGTPLWRKTDAIGGMGPKLDIDKYFYDEARTAPMLHWEDPAPPKDERKPREVREPLRLDHFLQYKFFEDASYDGDAEAMATRLVDQKKGFTLCGRPGTGKTTLANVIIDLLEEKGIKYMAFSTTHVSKKKMGSKKSQLRTNKNANTIDSLYRRWRHKQEFVITSCKQVEYILVDEISMMREKFYAMLCHIKRAIPGIKMILIGDIEHQFLPVKDTWEGNYETSAALYDLCDGYKIKLTKCLREQGDGQELFDLCTDICNRKKIDISQFAPTEDTRENIAYLHVTRMKINEDWMAKETKDLPEDQVIRLPKVETDSHSQDVSLCEGTPVICIRKLKAMGMDNGERYTIQSITGVPDYSKMKREELRALCREKQLKLGGNKQTLLERLNEASSDLILRLDEDEDAEPIRVPRHLFQKHFYVAYAITYFQSQGCTLTGRYTIWDWDFCFVDWRAKNVAMSRATSKANVQIEQSLLSIGITDEEFINKCYAEIEERTKITDETHLALHLKQVDAMLQLKEVARNVTLLEQAASRVMTCLSGQDEEKLPFGEHPDDALPYETFAGEGICGCGRTLPKMATCGYCLCLAE
jgi:ABC-type oligopeptide transport system ATPase subunit